MVYLCQRRNPLHRKLCGERQRFSKRCTHRRLCPPLPNTGLAVEYYGKGVASMKSRRVATNGEETACCGFGCYHNYDSIYHESAITAHARTVIVR